MKNVENYKSKQINDIVSIVKVSSLLFVGIILCRQFNTNITSVLLELKNVINICFFVYQ